MDWSENLKYWSDELESGNPLIDGQHRELIRRFENLEIAIEKEHGYQEVKSVAAFLQRYVLTHFNTEEQDMLSFDYPRFAEHAEQHDICKQRIFQFKKFVESERDKNKVLNVALSMIGLWVRDHILNHDIQYIKYGKEKVKTKKIVNIDYHWSPSKSKIWVPELEIGVENLDSQHQKLVKWTEYITETKKISKKEYSRLLDFIQGFIYTHFTDEELFLIDIDYPEIEEHSQLHFNYRAEFITIKKQIDELIDEFVGDERYKPIIIKLFETYTYHIREDDIKFINFYKNKKTV